MLSEELIKQIFFQSDRPRRDPILANDVDIVQFAQNIESVVRIEAARTEHARCVSIVSDLNREVAKALDNQRPPQK
jgi:hypothetical protein